MKQENKIKRFEQLLNENKKWTKELQKDFDKWKKDGNVEKNADGTYSTQDAQWKNKLKDLDALKTYFLKEFVTESVVNESKSTFLDDKENILNIIDSLISEYDKFTKTVGPKHWRTTGSNFVELKKIKKDIKGFTEISDKDKDSDWVKKQL